MGQKFRGQGGYQRNFVAVSIGRIAVYEADDDGRAFPNMLKMRSWKLKNHLEVMEWARPGSVELIVFDELVGDVEAMSTWLSGYMRRHNAKPWRGSAALELLQDSYKSTRTREFNAQAHASTQMYSGGCLKHPWSEADLAFANNALDWEVEKLAGFRRLSLSIPKC